MPNFTDPPTTWTQQDEERLRELTERKAEFTQRNRAPIHDLILGSFEWPSTFTQTQRVGYTMKLTDWLIADADTIRDLLKPFDSGVRVAPPNKN